MTRFNFFIKEAFIRIFYISFGFFICFILFFINRDPYIFILIKPFFFTFFKYSWNISYINPPDLFLSSFYISFLYSFFIIIPVFYIHFFLFFVITWVFESFIFFICYIIISIFSIFISYKLSFYIFLPNTWYFFKSFEKTNFLFSFSFLPIIKPFIFFCFFIFIFLTFTFHLPVIFLFFFYKGIISFWSIFYYRNFVYFCFFFLSTIFSPPDVFSQFFISFILFFFFEFSCFFILLFFFNLFFIKCFQRNFLYKKVLKNCLDVIIKVVLPSVTVEVARKEKFFLLIFFEIIRMKFLK